MSEAACPRHEVAAGERFSREHTFRVEEVIGFALAAGDDNPLHHDAEFASNTRFGRLIVSGTRTTAVCVSATGTVLIGLDLSVGAAGSMNHDSGER